MFLARFLTPILFLLMSAMGCSALAGSVYPVKRGDPDRKAILDAVRPKMEALMRGPVKFKVFSLDTYEGVWAFGLIEPVRPDGKAVNPATTAFARDIDFMDGLTTYILLKHANKRWNIIDVMIGPTDAAFTVWPLRYGVPKALLGITR